MWGCLRRAGVLCIGGAFFAWAVAGVVFWNGHSQNVWWLLRHQSQIDHVIPRIWRPVNDEAEATLGGLAAFTEHPKLETLLIICEGIYNVRHLQLHKFPSEEIFLALVTVSFEPILQRFRHVKGKPFVFHLIIDEAGSKVSSWGAQTVVELHTLLIRYSSLLDEHPQLCTG